MTQPTGPMLAPRSPLAAYREDLTRSERTAFGPSDATWLSVATILSHGVDVSSDERPPLLATLYDVVGSDPSLRGTLAAAPHDAPVDHELDAVSPIVRAIVERMEDDGALSLGYSTLAILAEADLRLSVLERGRVLAQLGRVAWKAGALETSREQYRRAEVLGRAGRIPELRVRAWVGYSILARLRGNYPDVRKWGTRAVHEAERAGLSALASLGYHSLMLSSAVAGDFNGALIYGWRAYRAAIGSPTGQPQALLSVSQLLLESGHPRVAVGGFMATLALDASARIALPACGGLAVASSMLGDIAGVRAAQIRAERLIATAGLPYESAAALLELSQALAVVNDSAGASECLARASEIASRHAYHELTHRLDALRMDPERRRVDAPCALDSDATEVARAVTSLALAGSPKVAVP